MFENEKTKTYDYLLSLNLSKDEALKIADDFINLNMGYIAEHGFYYDDIDLYLKIKNQIESTLNDKTPKAGDIVQIWSNNNKIFYKHAHIDKDNYSNTGFSYCEQPYTPWYNLKLKTCSVSGGAFYELDINKLQYVGTQTKTFCNWGYCGACGNGAIYINAQVNVYKLITNKKFIPLYCWTIGKVDEYGYKYFVDRKDKSNYSPHCYKTCFRTLAGFKRYLKDRHLKIGKQLNYDWGTTHEIIGDFDYCQVMSLEEYKSKKGNLKEFPLIDNGSYTGAFYKDNVVYFCNCNVHNRPKYTYIHE